MGICLAAISCTILYKCRKQNKNNLPIVSFRWKDRIKEILNSTKLSYEYLHKYISSIMTDRPTDQINYALDAHWQRESSQKVVYLE